MGQRSLACRELAQGRCGGVLVQPVQHGVRAVIAGQVVVQGLQPGVNRAGVAAQELFQALPQGAAGAPARQVLGAGAASRAGMPEGRGGRQAAQSGLAGVPPRISRMLPQPAQHARRFWQARHHGSPVILEISAGASLAQIEQIIVFAGLQAGHSGPSGVRVLTTRRRAQLTHVSRLAGSEVRQ